MTYDTLRVIFLVSAALAVVMFVVSLLLFVVLKIPKVISDLSGATAKKAIEKIRNQNEQSGDKIYKSSRVNKERGKLTDKISPSGRIERKETAAFGGAMPTAKISTQHFAEATTQLDTFSAADQTTQLNQTGLSDRTSILHRQGAETSILDNTQDKTVVLLPNRAAPSGIFDVIEDITFLHTNEQL